MGKVASAGDFLGCSDFFHVRFQDAIKNIIGRQGIGVLLIGPQLGGGRFLDASRGG